MNMVTITQIARESGFAAHQVRHAIKTQSITATVRAGAQGLQLFNRRRVQQITRALDKYARRRPETPVAQQQG